MSDRPSVALVGAGRVGRALGKRLAVAGYPVHEVVARTLRSARAAARFVGEGRPFAIGSLVDVQSDIVLVAVPDDVIASVANRLAHVRSRWTGAVVLHTSGSRDAAELAELAALEASVGSMHPLQSFPTAELGVARVPGSVFAIEGGRGAVAAARRIARAVGARPVRVKPGAKSLYHAAAVLASGGVTSLVDVSLDAMRRAGLSETDAVAAILPLVRGTVENITDVGTTEALTGPFVRGDDGTIARNREALGAVDPEFATLYDALVARAQEIVARRRRR